MANIKNLQMWNTICSDAIGNFHPKATYMAEVCSSRDGEFLAVLLFQFVQLSYAPVTDVLIFEGSDARIVKQLF